MKTLILLALSAVCLLPLTAQDWEPFVYGKMYYYGQSFDNDVSIRRLEVDTSMDDFLRFLHPVACDSWGHKETVETYHQLGNFLDLTLPLFYFAGDEDFNYGYLIEGALGPSIFTFRPYSKVGDSWITNHLTMSCIGEDTMSIFGVLDSIRTFQCLTTPIDTLTFILSKTHGLIQFPPFRNLDTEDASDFGPDFVLMGVHDDTTSLGFKQPEFEDYFSLKPGDILFWRDDRVTYFPIMEEVITYYVDTIKTVAQNQDTLFYYKQRSEFNSNGEHVSTATRVDYHLRSREGSMLDGVPGWFVNPDVDFSFEQFYSIDPLTLSDSEGDTLISTCIDPAFLNICPFQLHFDVSGRYCYSTKKGLTSVFYGGAHGDQLLSLIGSIINGIADGIVEIPTATTDISLDKAIVYPNPVTDILNLPASTESISIFNMHGTLMQSQRGDTTIIDVSDFPPGLYVLQIMNQDGNFVITRVVKQ